LPVVLWLANRNHWFDDNGPLKIHTRPIPRLGGISIALGLCWVLFIGRDNPPTFRWPVIATFFIVWATGLLDDLVNLPPIARLAVQLGAGAALGLAGWRFGLTGSPIADIVATSILVATFINAFNLLDGADGVAGGVALTVAVGYACLPTGQLTPDGRHLALALAACCASFLLFNFPPARVFMGDSGSTLLGLAIAFLGLDFSKSDASSSARLVFPITVSALPIVDLCLAILRRARRNRSLFEGDRQHFYDLLLQSGWPSRRVAIVCSLLNAAFVAIGLIGIRESTEMFLILATLGTCSLTYAAISLGSLRLLPDHAAEVR
jgi:UDP-GlcNAc:undecaprenyl-phosphate GlcNAc-1-phosphate transferase